MAPRATANALQEAIRANNLPEVRRCLEGGTPPAGPRLLLACKQLSVEIVQLLLQFGANANVRESFEGADGSKGSCPVLYIICDVEPSPAAAVIAQSLLTLGPNPANPNGRSTWSYPKDSGAAKQSYSASCLDAVLRHRNAEVLRHLVAAAVTIPEEDAAAVNELLSS